MGLLLPQLPSLHLLHLHLGCRLLHLRYHRFLLLRYHLPIFSSFVFALLFVFSPFVSERAVSGRFFFCCLCSLCCCCRCQLCCHSRVVGMAQSESRWFRYHCFGGRCICAICLLACLFVCLSVCLFICLSVCIF